MSKHLEATRKTSKMKIMHHENQSKLEMFLSEQRVAEAFIRTGEALIPVKKCTIYFSVTTVCSRIGLFISTTSSPFVLLCIISSHIGSFLLTSLIFLPLSFNLRLTPLPWVCLIKKNARIMQTSKGEIIPILHHCVNIFSCCIM